MNTTTSTIIKVTFFEPVSGKCDHYFGSLKAIFNELSEEQVGCSLGTLYSNGISKGNAYVNDKCRITKEILTRVKQLSPKA